MKINQKKIQTQRRGGRRVSQRKEIILMVLFVFVQLSGTLNPEVNSDIYLNLKEAFFSFNFE
jgi:hypothetical protein